MRNRLGGSGGGAVCGASPMAALQDEHGVMRLVLEAAEREAEHLRRGKGEGLARVRQILGFFREFVEECHQVKEEHFLFPMVRACLPREGGDAVERFLEEHEQGRALATAAGRALAAAHGEAAALSAYAEHLRAHMAGEDATLWPLAARALTAHDRRALVAAFEKVEAQEMGLGRHDELCRAARELAET